MKILPGRKAAIALFQSLRGTTASQRGFFLDLYLKYSTLPSKAKDPK